MNQERNNWWDWCKLIAAVAMVYDHWRFVNPACGGFVVIGRIAMPLFLVISASSRMYRARGHAGLLVPALLAEPFFYLVTAKFGNVLFFFAGAFFWTSTGNVLGLLLASVCDYGVRGIAAVWALCSFRKLNAGVAGFVLNPWPLCLISASAALLPLQKIRMPALRWLHGPVLVWFYPVHLAILWAVKSLWF